MKLKARVKLINKPGQDPYYGVYLIDFTNQENIMNVFSFKKDISPDDNVWGEDRAKADALAYAKKIEETDLFQPYEKIIYETPSNE